MSVAWVGAAVAVAGAASQVINSNKAKNAQQAAIARANAGLQDEADQARDDYAPYRDTGTAATTALNGLMKDPNSITKDPGYQFGLGQGQQAIDRSAAGAGGLYSGATLKALERYGQNYAGTKLNDAYTRYGAAAQLGLNAVNGTTQSGQNAANNIANNTIGSGNVEAASDVANGTAISNGLNQAVAAYAGGGTGGGSSSPFAGTMSQYTPKGSVWGSTWGSEGQDKFFYGNGSSGD